MEANFGFLAYNGFEDMDLVGPWEMIALWKKYADGPNNIFIISETKELITSFHGLNVMPHLSFEECPRLNYLLIPGGEGRTKELNNSKLLEFIKQQATHCEAVLSVCTGAFLLQAAGLLHGKKATTFWEFIDRLKKFTDVEVIQERFIRDQNIWTGAGISAGIDLALAFIANVAGEKAASTVQLQSEYFPSPKIYEGGNYLPPYVKK